MREMKFRAWDKKNQKFIYNVEKTYDYRCRGFGADEDSFQDILEDDNYVVQQYTGLKDKNNEEIYEGDIIEYQNDITSKIVAKGIVVYDNNECLYAVNNAPLQHFVYGTEIGKMEVFIKVVGDIFEEEI